MSSSILRGLNSTNVPLLANGIFLGQSEFAGSLLSVLVNCYADTEIKVEVFEYSTPALTVAVPISITTIPALTYQQVQVNLNFPYVKLVITNMAATNQNQLNINTIYTNLLPLGAGLLDLSGNVVVSGSVAVSNLITETLATRRVDFLVVGTFYRVASVGITSGAEWNAIGAIVNGESVPVIGRLFKCLQVGPAVAGGGECYDVEYTDDVSATISNFPANQVVSGTVSLTDPTSVRIRDAYGDPITTTAGNLMVGINNIYTANPLHVIVDSITPPTTAVAGALAVSTIGITLKASAGKLLTLFMNSDGALGTNYVKLYNVAVPTSADTPIFTIAINFGASQNVDCASLNFSTAIGVRCTNASAAADNTPPTNTINITAFFV